MRSWQLQQARGQFSSLIDAALTEGPQRVTRRGRQAVVVVSEAEWRRISPAAGSDWAAHLLGFPVAGDDLPVPPRRPARARRDPPFG